MLNSGPFLLSIFLLLFITTCYLHGENNIHIFNILLITSKKRGETLHEHSPHWSSSGTASVSH